MHPRPSTLDTDASTLPDLIWFPSANAWRPLKVKSTGVALKNWPTAKSFMNS